MKREWRKTGSGQPVELRSEEVREQRGQGPVWIVLWCATLLFLPKFRLQSIQLNLGLSYKSIQLFPGKDME